MPRFAAGLAHGAETPVGAFSSWPRYGGGGDGHDAAVAEARRLIEADRAQSTLRHYARDWAQFVGWVGERHGEYPAIPAPAPLVGLYIGQLRLRRLAKSTILGRLAAIQYAHELARTVLAVEGADAAARDSRLAASA